MSTRFLRALCLLFAACSTSSEATEPSGCEQDCLPRTDDDLYAFCNEQDKTLASNEPSAFGFSAEDVLGASGGTLTGVLQWGPVPTSATCDPQQADATFAELTTQLEIELSTRGAETVEYTYAEDWSQYTGSSAPPACPAARLEVDVTLRFATADGSFDEAFAAKANVYPFELPDVGDMAGYVSAPRAVPDWGSRVEGCVDAVIEVVLPVDNSNLVGSYDPAVRYPNAFPDDFGPIETTLTFAFCGAAVRGDAFLGAEQMGGDGVSVVGAGGGFFRFSADATPDGGAAVTSLFDEANAGCAQCRQASHPGLDDACASCLCAVCPDETLACDDACGELVTCGAANCLQDLAGGGGLLQMCVADACPGLGADDVIDDVSAFRLGACILDACETECARP